MLFSIYKRKINKLESILGRCQLYLIPGAYRLSLSEDIVYNTSVSSSLQGLTFSSKIEIGVVRSLINRFINVFVLKIIRQETKCIFHGSEVVLTSSKKEYKVFDYNNKEVVSLFSDLERQQRIEENKLFFSKYFNVPRTIEYKPDIYYQKEKLIMHAPYYVDDAFTDIIQKYLNYCKSINVFQKECGYWKERNTIFSERFGDSVLLQELEKLPIIFTHGDLWSSNVIYDGNTFYITDFENGLYRFFGYDLMTFICSEWFINKDASLINSYLSGKWDSNLIKIAQLFSLSFDGRMKHLFLLAFIVTIFYERWRFSDELDDTIKVFIKIYVPNYISVR